ncbi:hypothetical protein [Salinibacter ruber]|uniref:Arginine utilization protein RocB n=1 Tax=Salinibacter ruber TaxID=146919 RepID=A0AAW5P7D8_9BACT|nr:hypothetical protein [Salinibacter ruber]MCS4157746.1 arginine utilization protein RocB [Salinibacter ruber]
MNEEMVHHAFAENTSSTNEESVSFDDLVERARELGFDKEVISEAKSIWEDSQLCQDRSVCRLVER